MNSSPQCWSRCREHCDNLSVISKQSWCCPTTIGVRFSRRYLRGDWYGFFDSLVMSPNERALWEVSGAGNLQRRKVMEYPSAPKKEDMNMRTRSTMQISIMSCRFQFVCELLLTESTDIISTKNVTVSTDATVKTRSRSCLRCRLASNHARRQHVAIGTKQTAMPRNSRTRICVMYLLSFVVAQRQQATCLAIPST